MQTKEDKKSENSFKKLLITVLNYVIFIQSVTLLELFIKLINRNTIIIYWTHMYSNSLSHFCYKDVQEVYIELQKVQKIYYTI